MHWFGLVLEWSSVALQVCIFVLMGRRNLYRRFPLFALYTAYLILATVLRSLFLPNPHVYFYVYWVSEPGEIVLAILAVHESFKAVFGAFYLLWWFRFLFPGAIIAALGYSAWHAYVHPPLQVSALGAAIISMAIAAQYVIVCITVLFFVLLRFIRVRWRLYEFRIVFGFGVSALAVAFAGLVRSEFGTKFVFLTVWLPGVAYLVAVLIWFSAMLGEEPKNGRNIAGRPSPEQLVEGLRHQLRTLKKFLGKK
jgi:hypothetical protein